MFAVAVALLVAAGVLWFVSDVPRQAGRLDPVPVGVTSCASFNIVVLIVATFRHDSATALLALPVGLLLLRTCTNRARQLQLNPSDDSTELL